MNSDTAVADHKGEVLQKRLIANRFFYSALGFANSEVIEQQLRNVSEGYTEEGHSNFYYALRGLGGLAIAPDTLARYDLRIAGYLQLLRTLRGSSLSLKYFQYLALLLSEYYLNRLFSNRTSLLGAINEYISAENKRRANGYLYCYFTDADLNKIAIWMATGSGKTLIMHANVWQYMFYCPTELRPDNVLLVTPNEGLSKQHTTELRKSGIRVRDLSSTAGDLFSNDVSVTVVEITKLVTEKRGSGVTIDVSAFGSKNLLLVDEGHRGSSGDLWRDLRARLAERGFTFEYSATFGEIVNGAPAGKRRELMDEYSKAILFDYSYPHFYRDGYGKDYWVTNLRDSDDQLNRWLFLGNLLSFYEQCLAFEENPAELREHNIEKPLWIFVGHSVTGGKSIEDQVTLTDVQQTLLFFDRFVTRPREAQHDIDAILKGESGLKNTVGEDLYSRLYPYLRKKSFTPEEIYRGVLRSILNAAAGGCLQAIELKRAPGEIAIRVGVDNPYFAVVNVGNSTGLLKLLDTAGIATGKDAFTGSLFERLNDLDSLVNVLIGSRKFTEGWDSFRVSSMGLINIGRGEGAQIIQLFGRGVRLKGIGNSLKRTSALAGLEAPECVRVLQTLNVFGIRANYMAKFRDFISREGISADYTEETLRIQVREDFLQRQLHTLVPPEEVFETVTGYILGVDDDLSVRLSLETSLDVAESSIPGQQKTKVIPTADYENRAGELKALAPLLDWDRIYLDLLEFKSTKRLTNIWFNRSGLQQVVASARYTLVASESALKVETPMQLRDIEIIAAALLRKYVVAFHDRHRRVWEQSRIRLGTLDRHHLNLSFSYSLRIQTSFVYKVRDALSRMKEVYSGRNQEVPNVYFERHLYSPLLVCDWQQRVEMSPVGLNEGEREFVVYLRSHFVERKECYKNKEIYLLRNLTRSKGIGFFEPKEGDAFYPDFVLWVIEDNLQRIAFIDPHGLCHVSNGFDDPKIGLHVRIKELEKSLRPLAEIRLSSFILSTTRYEYARKAFRPLQPSKQAFEDNNVLFLEDGQDCVGKLLSRVCSD